jgi:hypothetical protein
VGDETGLMAVVLNPQLRYRRNAGQIEIYPGILDPFVGVPNPAQSLPELSVDSSTLAASVERFERLRGMPKEQKLTMNLVESAIIDDRLPVSDRENFKALLPNFEYYSPLWRSPFSQPFIDLNTAKSIDDFSLHYDKFLRSAENYLPEAAAAFKYISTNFDKLDIGHKGRLDPGDFEQIFSNQTSLPDRNTAVSAIYAMQHSYYGTPSQIYSSFQREVEKAQPWNKEWYFELALNTPYSEFRTNLQSIKNADREALGKIERVASH